MAPQPEEREGVELVLLWRLPHSTNWHISGGGKRKPNLGDVHTEPFIPLSAIKELAEELEAEAEERENLGSTIRSNIAYANQAMGISEAASHLRSLIATEGSE